MLKNARPSQYFIGAILRAYDKEAQRGKPVGRVRITIERVP